VALQESLAVEYQALTAGAGLVDASDRTKIELRGDDRAGFLNNFCTNDIKRLQPGQGCEAFICNVKGHVIGHVAVFCDESSLWLDTAPGQAQKLLSHLDRYLIREKVELIDRTSDYQELILSGEKVSGLFEGVSIDRMTPGEHVKMPSPSGAMVGIYRVDLTAHHCCLLTFPANDAIAMRRLLQLKNVVECSHEALDIVRIENGFPLYGVDITDDNLPQEVARDAKAISFTKGCYLGQETVARIDALGHVNKALCGVAFLEGTVPAAGAELSSGDKIVGHVTSACWSPKLGKPLGLAYLRRGHNAVGTTLQSQTGKASIVALPA